MKNTKTHRSSEQFTLRFPDGMRNQIKAMAEANRRTANAEIIFLIERGMATDRRLEQPTNGAE